MNCDHVWVYKILRDHTAVNICEKCHETEPSLYLRKQPEPQAVIDNSKWVKSTDGVMYYPLALNLFWSDKSKRVVVVTWKDMLRFEIGLIVESEDCCEEYFAVSSIEVEDLHRICALVDALKNVTFEDEAEKDKENEAKAEAEA